MLKLVYINNIKVRLLEPCQLKIFQSQRCLKIIDSPGNSRLNYACDNATIENFLKNH